MSEIKLLSCPFCGGEAKIGHYYPHMTRRVKTKIYCEKCRANSGDWGRQDKAIEAWNTRKPMEQIVERLEEERQKALVFSHTEGNMRKAIDIVRAGGKE